MTTDKIRDALPPDIARVYASCITEDLRKIAELRREMDDYVDGLREQAESDAFLDLETALCVWRGCVRLLDALENSPSTDAHAAVQAATDYFILEDDAESDDSVIGFDDDLLVVEETFRLLGWPSGDLTS